MKHIAGIAAMFTLAAPCFGQVTHMGMPEASKDVYMTLMLASAPSSEGSARRETFVAPLLSAQFANGVFIDMNTVGLYLSHDHQLAYGVQMTPTLSRIQMRTAQGWEEKRKLTPELGGFVRYNLVHGVQLHSTLMYGRSADHRGLRLKLGAMLGMPVAEHHGVGMEFAATFANRSALQANFGVFPEQAGPGMPAYGVNGGVRDTRIAAFWSWELSTKYTLKARLWHSRLHGSAAASPRVEKAGGGVAAAGLTYQF